MPLPASQGGAGVGLGSLAELLGLGLGLGLLVHLTQDRHEITHGLVLLLSTRSRLLNFCPARLRRAGLIVSYNCFQPPPLPLSQYSMVTAPQLPSP